MDLSQRDQSIETGGDAAGAPELSEREQEILALVATGASNKQIAQQLIISPNTVKVHLRNIFAKIKVTSRTEATLYALRTGLVDVPINAAAVEAAAAAEDDLSLTTEAGAEAVEVAAAGPGPAPTAEQPAQPEPEAPAPARRGGRLPWLAAGVLIVSVLVIAWAATRSGQTTLTTPTAAAATAIARWQTRASLPTARTGLAAAAYENQVYAIGGEAAEGVTGQVERYDPASDAWDTLRAKPVAVADAGAAVIHGLIYIPGGRLASGEATDVLEVYNPRDDTWEQRAPLPAALSGFAFVTLEGQLYVLGGWDGETYTAEVFRYSPTANAWETLTPMPTARAFAVAAASGGRIYVIGGRNDSGLLNSNEEYVPENEGTGEGPWRSRSPLPDPRYAMGAASQADIIHVVGGSGNADGEPLTPLKYIPARDEWQSFEQPTPGAWAGLGVTAVERYVYALGGQQALAPSALNMSYEAVYTIDLPVMVPEP